MVLSAMHSLQEMLSLALEPGSDGVLLQLVEQVGAWVWVAGPVQPASI